MQRTICFPMLGRRLSLHPLNFSMLGTHPVFCGLSRPFAVKIFNVWNRVAVVRAAHWNEQPLYDAEVRKALKLVECLENVLIS
jgi:hypothetical protein